MICKKELLKYDSYIGAVTYWRRLDSLPEKEYYENIVWTCKGTCDNIATSTMYRINNQLYDSWENVSDLTMPTEFLNLIMKMVQNYREGTLYSEKAFDNLETLLENLFPYVVRHLSKSEKERAQILNRDYF